MEDDGQPPRKRGRRPRCNNDRTNHVIMKYKLRVLEKNKFGQVVVTPEGEDIWKEISHELDNERTPHALYCYVTGNRNKIRELLDPTFTPQSQADDFECSDEELELSTLQEPMDVSVEYDFQFRISEPADEYLNIVNETEKNRENEPTDVRKTRHRKKATPGVWTKFVMLKCWENTTTTHGFLFSRNRVNEDYSGYFYGKCDCGSELDCFVSVENEIMTMECKATKGTVGVACSVRPVREPERSQWGEEMLGKSAKVFRAGLAGKMMKTGDPRPAMIPSLGVLRVIKHKAITKQYVDPDPIIALEKLQGSTMDDEMTLISSDPFMVIYSTKAQQEMWRKLSEETYYSVSIDSTGSLLQNVIRPDKSSAGPMYFYQIVVRTKTFQISLGQMISSTHMTRDILLWLEDFIETLNLPYPNEVVMDGAPALQTAAVRAFSSFPSRKTYCDAFLSAPPSCWIRSDGSHFLKTYVDLLVKVKPYIARYYKAAVGRLITSRDLEEAQMIVKSILTTCQSEHRGKNTNQTDSASDTQREIMQELLTTAPQNLDCFEEEDSQRPTVSLDQNEEDLNEEAEDSKWSKWGEGINKTAMNDIKLSPGTEPSLYYFPELAAKLLTDIAYIPMWGCFASEFFPEARIPASSSSVENDFNQTKNLLLNGQPKLRVDVFCQVHKEYIDNCLKLINAELKKTQSGECESLHETPCREKVVNNAEEEQPHSMNENSSTDLIPSSEDIEIPTGPLSQSKLSTPREVLHPDNDCPACAVENFPTGLHRCHICNEAVHLLDQCSISIGDNEGCGEKRECLKCAGAKSLRIEHSQIPDQPKTSAVNPSRYFNKIHSAEAFQPNVAVENLPFLQYAEKLNASVKEGVLYNLKSTDLFNNIFHLLLASAIDSKEFWNSVQMDRPENSFLACIEKIRNNRRVHRGIYNQRFEILYSHFSHRQSGHPELNAIIVDCESTAGQMCNKLLNDIAPFKKSITCSNNCDPREERLVVMPIPIEALIGNSQRIDEVLTETSSRAADHCQTAGCGITETSSISVTGNFIFLETILSRQPHVFLNQIPQTIKTSSPPLEMKLKGLIHYEPPRSVSSRSTLMKGTYTTYCWRNKTWWSCDTKWKVCKKNPKICPDIILYGKE